MSLCDITTDMVDHFLINLLMVSVAIAIVSGIIMWLMERIMK